jgi:hypothetical protein
MNGHVLVYELKKGDRILILNCNLDNRFAAYDQFKCFSALVTDVKRAEYGDDMRYQLTMGEHTSGWYDRGYMMHYDWEDSMAERLEEVTA